jgi:hypothetical protein
MTLASTPATPGTPVANWLLPTPTETETRIKLETVVMQTRATDEARVRPLRTLSAVARRALVEEIEAKLRMVMNETLVDLILGGWRAHTAITQAIQKSRGEPGVNQIVALCSHTITANSQHNLDIEVDAVPLMTLSAQLVVRLQLYDAVAVVRDGQLVAVRSGQAKADGTVTVDGVQVAQRTLTFPLTAELALHSPRSAPVGSNGGVTSSPAPPPSVPAGWHPDPRGARLQRYWNGTAWTQHTAPLT